MVKTGIDVVVDGPEVVNSGVVVVGMDRLDVVNAG